MSELYYKKEAGWDWNAALPVGNGRLGAMIFGNAKTEKLQLNEDSLWYGGPMNRINKDALANLRKVRELILSGKISEAEELMLHSFSGNPPSMRPYAPLGELNIDYKNIKSSCLDYLRRLDLETAVHTVEKTYNETAYIEEIFASAVENVIAVRIYSDDDSAFDINVECGRMVFYDKAFHDENNVYFIGKTAGTPYSFCGGMTAKADEGEISLQGQYIVCSNVKNLVIYLSAATSYRGDDPYEYVKARLENVREKDYETIKSEHIEDYRKYYSITKQ